MDLTVNAFLTKTFDALYKMGNFEDINSKSKDIVSFMVSDLKLTFPEILENIRKDAKEADLLHNLEKNKIDPLVRAAFNVAFNYEAVQYAKKIINHFKITCYESIS